MVAHIFCDLNDLFIGTQQGIRSLLHPVIVQVVFKGLSADHQEADLEESDHAGKVCGGTGSGTSVKESGSGRIGTGCRVKNGKSGLKE